MQLVEVQVKQGLLRGQRLTPPHKHLPPFDAFLGVPYAKPPLKELRFKAPQPPEPWQGALPALDHRADSLQVDFMSRATTGGEDCLYLNVYSPQVPSSVRHPVEGAPWPVMVWFYPGGYTSGTSHMTQFAPEHLVARGVVVVTVTHRLGALGFLSLRTAQVPGNAGLKDAVASLRWVRDNVAVFGGDPNRVTVFGCSAGGAICEQLQLAPSARGLFHRAISQSGSALNPWAHVQSADVARSRAFRLGEALGCSTQDDAELLAFLQTVPARDILDKSNDVVDPDTDGTNNLVFPFLPVSEAGVEAGGEEPFLPDTPRNLLTSNRFFPVPWIIGLTDAEGMLVMDDSFAMKGISSKSQLDVVDNDLERMIPTELGLEKGCPESLALAQGIRELYFSGAKVNRNGYWNLCSDLLFGTGIVDAARIHAAHPAAAPVFFYLFCVVGDDNVFSGFLKPENPTGACHGDELGYLWGRRPPFPPEPEWEPHSLEATTKRRLTALWTNFARTGIPAPASDPDADGVEWTPLPADPTAKGPIAPFLDIGASLSVPRAPLWEDRVAFWDEVYAKHCPKPK